MFSSTITVNGIELDVEAEIAECRDAYGTGDSPTLYETEDLKVSIAGINITSLISDAVEFEIENAVIQAFKGD